MRFHLFMAVWGTPYVRLLLEVALPSLLAPGNIPALPKGSRLVVLTRPEDEAVLRAHPLWEQVGAFLEMRVIPLDPATASTPYEALGRAHALAAAEACADKALAIVLCPDALVADGVLASVVDLAAAGKRVVLVPGLRLSQEAALAALRADDVVTTPSHLAPRALLRRMLPHLHPENQRYRWDSPEFTRYPVLTLWDRGEQGLLLRAFHLHPLLVDMRSITDLSALQNGTIDGPFIGRAFPCWDDLHVEGDSDRILIFSLTPESERQEPREPRRATVEALRVQAYRPSVTPLHRRLAMQACKLHTQDLTEDWRRLEEETGQIMQAALDIAGKEGLYAPDLTGRELLRLLLERLWARMRRRFDTTPR